MDLVELIYASSRAWPKDELYGLTSQIRRAAVSVPSNIAEGQGRATTGEFLSHLGIAYGSLMEVETQVLIAARLGYLEQDAASKIIGLIAEIGRLLNGLTSSLGRRN
jgi:four helix bundle protein